MSSIKMAGLDKINIYDGVRYLSIMVLLLLAANLKAQDTIHLKIEDSIIQKAVVDTPIFPVIQFGESQSWMTDQKKDQVVREVPMIPVTSSELPFYFMLGFTLLIGFSRVVFNNYFNNLFRIFFQSSFRQKSTRENLLQNRLASMFLNFFFFISAGMFVYLLAIDKGYVSALYPFWLQAGIFISAIALVYGIKYLGLRLSGWLFGVREVTETYGFIVFLINKIAGVMLLPVILVMWLGSPAIKPVFEVSAMLLIGILFLYRYVIALPVVRKYTTVSSFHFFIYLCAFEILPLMLLYKLTIEFLNG